MLLRMLLLLVFLFCVEFGAVLAPFVLPSPHVSVLGLVWVVGEAVSWLTIRHHTSFIWLGHLISYSDANSQRIFCI